MIGMAEAFIPFNKIPRLIRQCTISEKIDGTNGVIRITPEGRFLVGSRNRWLSLGDDNYGFAKWAYENRDDLMGLGEGWHHGEWWGPGIQRGYGIKEKRFSLFNTKKWLDDTIRPKCCDVVPVISTGIFSEVAINNAIIRLSTEGSLASPGFMRPEGIVIYHHAGESQQLSTPFSDRTMGCR